jgi:hypothetical protein
MSRESLKRAKESVFLLEKYYRLGWLERKYLVNCKYIQPYSAEDRLLIGKRLYNDFVAWQKGARLTRDYDEIYVDVSPAVTRDMHEGYSAERFRHAIGRLSKNLLPIVYRIVLEEKEIKAPTKMSAREKLYFNDEVKGMLCRGLDELIKYRCR